MKNDNTEIKAEIKVLPLKTGNTEIKRGGMRKGAGRKPLPPDKKRVSFTVRLSRKRFDRLCLIAKRARIGKTDIIEGVIEHLQLEGENLRKCDKGKVFPIEETIFVEGGSLYGVEAERINARK